MQLSRNMQLKLHFHSNMQKYAKKITIESTHYETSIFIIKIILGEL